MIALRAMSALLVLSGAAALLLQVLWARDFALVLGATATGTAVVLAAFFAGLMLGAEIGGRVARPRSGALVFAGIEVGVAFSTLAYAVFVRPTLPELSMAISAAFPDRLGTAARALLAPAILIVPTTLIGASLPAALASQPRRDASAMARLYAWNTLGGAAGALGALVALHAFGTRGSFFTAAALDLTVAVLAVRLIQSRAREQAQEDGAASRPETDEVEEARAFTSPGRAALVTGLVGFAALANEVLWTRGLSGVLSNSVYSIAFVLAAVLLGLVAGAGTAARLSVDRSRIGARLALACAGLAVTTLASRLALANLPAMASSLAATFEVRGPAAGLAVEMVLGMSVVFVPALFFGAIFPLCVAMAGGESRGLGRLLAANTAGGLLGAPVAAFLFLPTIGLGGGLIATAALAALAALIASWAAEPRVRLAAAVAAAGVGAIALIAPSQYLAWQGRYGAEELLFHRDGPAATVMVTGDARGGKRLLVNGQYSLGGTDGVLLEKRQGHIPLLLHSSPERVLVLGVGTGATVGAALAHPGVQVDGVEIVPEVLQAAALFERENDRALENARARLVIADARSFLLDSDRYDVIVSDLFLPWTAGTAYLYSRELFALARERLRPGGLFCQWLPLHQLGLADLQSIIATFVDVFPHTSLWLAYHRSTAPIAALVGSEEPLRFDGERLRSRLAASSLATALRGVGLDDPTDLALLRIADDTELRAATKDAEVISDDRPHLELSAPAAYFHQSGLAAESLRWLATLIGPDASPFDASPESAASANAASPSVRKHLLEAQLALLEGNGPAELTAYLEAFKEAPSQHTSRRALLAIARSRLAAGDVQTARAIDSALLELAPKSEEARRLDAAIAR